MHATTALVAKAAALLPSATRPPEPSGWDTSSIIGLAAAVLGLLIAVSAIPIAAKSKQGNVKGAMNVGTVNLVAVAVFILGVGITVVMGFVTGLFDTIFG